MIFKAKRILAVVLLLTLAHITHSFDDHSILFGAKPTKKDAECRMHHVECTINVLITKQLSISDLNISSLDDETTRYKSIEVCKTNCSLDPFSYLNRTNFLDTHVFYRVNIIPVLIGSTSLVFTHNSSGKELARYEAVIKQPKRIIDYSFDGFIWINSITVSFLMGILIDRESLMKIIVMPKAVAIGFCCQYIFMPLISFGVARFFNLTPLESLAIFIYGCSPGGAGSNNWTILFDGDLDLSAILTFVSTCSSIIMMPTWMYTLGDIFTREAKITIPLMGLLVNLIVTIVPCFLGLTFCYFFPKLKKLAVRIAKPYMLIGVVIFFTLLFASRAYTFRLIRLRHWTSGPFIPYIGFTLGITIAFLMRLSPKQIKTVALETGIQNIGVAILIIFTNLPAPYADYASFPIFAIAFMTPLPLTILFIIKKVIENIKKRREEKLQKTSTSLETESAAEKGENSECLLVKNNVPNE